MGAGAGSKITNRWSQTTCANAADAQRVDPPVPSPAPSPPCPHAPIPLLPRVATICKGTLPFCVLSGKVTSCSLTTPSSACCRCDMVLRVSLMCGVWPRVTLDPPVSVTTSLPSLRLICLGLLAPAKTTCTHSTAQHNEAPSHPLQSNFSGLRRQLRLCGRTFSLCAHQTMLAVFTAFDTAGSQCLLRCAACRLEAQNAVHYNGACNSR